MITINAKLVRAAMACQAKNDVRYYLTGILIAKNGDIVGTDGHALFRGTHVWTDKWGVKDDGLIIRINGTIPVGADTVTFNLAGDAPTVTTDNGKIFTCEVIDGRYPDYTRVIPSKDSDQYSTVLNFNASLLAKAEKVFGKDSKIALHHRGPNNSILIECAALPDSCLVIMPMKAEVAGQPLFLQTD
jgi:DNA polymerase III sliding clamp (beta) subunit (PCNA family)